jgi:hypothetical protein
MRKRKEERTVELLEKYKGIAIKLAWEYWKKLPAATKMWIDPEDMIAEAVCHLVAFVLNERQKTHVGYDKERAGFGTFLYMSTNGHMMNFMIAQLAAKRYGFRADLEEAFGVGVKENRFQLVEALNAFESVYQQASFLLKREISSWFGAGRKAPRRSRVGRELIGEFAFLARKNSLSESDCRLLLKSGVWVP